MKKVTLFLLLTGFCAFISAQTLSSFRDSILKENFKKDIAFLCDPGLSGRKFASPGEAKSADYIRNQFAGDQLSGINTGKDIYFQRYIYSIDTLRRFTIENYNGTLEYVSDFFTFGFLFMHSTPEIEFIYAGFGLDRDDYSDYRNIDVKNKWVVAEINSPVDSTGKLMNYFDNNLHVNFREISAKTESAWKHGAKGVVFKMNSRRYVPDLLSHIIENRHLYRSKDDITLNLADSIFPYIYARDEIIDSVMGIKHSVLDSIINAKLKNHESPAGLMETRVSFNIEIEKRNFGSQNVVGVIQGVDDKIGMVISAHYDAVKENDSLIYPGANDNASGTTSVLQLAKVFSGIAKSGYIPEKSIAFILFSGEEAGLVGSRNFVNHLPFLIDSSAVVINLDCVGIVDTSKFSSYGACVAAPEDILNRYGKMINDIASKEGQLYRIDFSRFYEYSDNLSFTNGGYRAMHISTGGGEVMHTIQDRPERIDYDNLLKVTQLVFDFVNLNMNFIKR
jgi:hypothetical protein